MRDERGPWYLLTGLVIGIVLGLIYAWYSHYVYAWLFSPMEIRDTSPAYLQSEFKDQYRAMIAAAFVANGNLARAEARLELLNDEDVMRALAEQAQRTLAEGVSPREAQALGLLAVALGQGNSSIIQNPIPTEGSTQDTNLTPASTTATLEPASQNIEESPSPTLAGETQQVTQTGNSTFSPLPTRTPTEMVESPFVLQESSFECDRKITGPLIQIYAEDSDGRPLSREGVIVTWDDGEDLFFTGLKPELGRGYADFLMTPGIVYEVRMASGGQTVSDLTPAECETQAGRRYWGFWKLIFTQP